MKIVFLSLILLTLSGCTVTRQAHVSEIDVPNAVVRLTWQQMVLQDARTDPYVAQGLANNACLQSGFGQAVAYGQPVATCSLFAGSLCLNTTFTLSYQCQPSTPIIVQFYPD